MTSVFKSRAHYSGRRTAVTPTFWQRRDPSCLCALLPYIEPQSSVSDRIPRYSPLKMLERRKGRGGGGGGGDGSVAVDDWEAPSIVKAQMAFEIIWACIVLYLISTLVRVLRNVPSRQRQPYILLLVSAILLAIGLIMHAVAIRIAYITFGTTILALDSTSTLLWQQPVALITMAGLWVFRKRSQLIIYGKGAKGIPYAGKMWKFVADWTIASLGLLFLLLAVIVDAAGYSLAYDRTISPSEYIRLFNAQVGLLYVQFAFYFILTIIFVVTGITLSGAFKRQLGHPDVVRHFPTRLRTTINFKLGHSSDADLGHALAHHSCTLYPD